MVLVFFPGGGMVIGRVTGAYYVVNTHQRILRQHIKGAITVHDVTPNEQFDMSTTAAVTDQ